MRRLGLIIGLILAVTAIYGAGPFPYIEQGVRLGGAIGASVIIMLTLNPLAKQFGRGITSRRLFLWAVDIVILVGFIYTLLNCKTLMVKVEDSGTGIHRSKLRNLQKLFE